MEKDENQLMHVFARWNHFIERTFKGNLPEGMSPPMHFLVMHLREPVSMSDMARMLQMSKQQLTKLADKVIGIGMAERVSDPNDRRVILLRATEKTKSYIAESEQQARERLRAMFDRMDCNDEEKFMQAIGMMNEVFIHMEESEEKNKGKETN